MTTEDFNKDLLDKICKHSPTELNHLFVKYGVRPVFSKRLYGILHAVEETACNDYLFTSVWVEDYLIYQTRTDYKTGKVSIFSTTKNDYDFLIAALTKKKLVNKALEEANKENLAIQIQLKKLRAKSKVFKDSILSLQEQSNEILSTLNKMKERFYV